MFPEAIFPLILAVTSIKGQQPQCATGYEPRYIRGTNQPLACTDDYACKYDEPNGNYRCLSSTIFRVNLCCRPMAPPIPTAYAACPAGQTPLVPSGAVLPQQCTNASPCTYPYFCTQSTVTNVKLCCKTDPLPACAAGRTSFKVPGTVSPQQCTARNQCIFPYVCEISTVPTVSLCCAQTSALNAQCPSGYSGYIPPGQGSVAVCNSQFNCFSPFTCLGSTVPNIKLCCTAGYSSVPTCPAGRTPMLGATGNFVVECTSSPLFCAAPYACVDSTVSGRRVCCSQPYQPSIQLGCPSGFAVLNFPSSIVPQQCCTNWNALVQYTPYYTCPAGSTCYAASTTTAQGVCCITGNSGLVPIVYGTIRYAAAVPTTVSYQSTPFTAYVHNSCPGGAQPFRFASTGKIGTCNVGMNPSGCPYDYYCYQGRQQTMCCPWTMTARRRSLRDTTGDFTSLSGGNTSTGNVTVDAHRLHPETGV